MRIVYVCADPGIPVLGTKGASVHVRQITSSLQRLGHTVSVAYARLGSGNPPPEVAEMFTLEEPNEQALMRLLRTTRADAVVERYALESGPARVATARLGVPLVLEVNAPIVLEAQRFRGLLDVEPALARERALFARADAIAAVSRALGRYVHSIASRARVEWVPNGADPAAFALPRPVTAGFPPGAVVLGFVGSMKPWHGVRELLAAFVGVARKWPSAHLLLCGTGPEESALRAAVPAALSDRVRFTGSVAHADVPGVLSSFDLAVAPYRASDDFYFSPLKVLEYLAAGRPVVYPAIGDLPELVGGGGISYPPREEGALTSSLERLVRDHDLRRRLGSAALLSARRWSWERAALAVERLVVEAQQRGAA